MASLGIGLAALVAMMALASAAFRRDPEALGATVYGMLRAGIGTGLVTTLTVLALGVADEITTRVAGAMMGQHAGQFWHDVGDAWGKDNFAGFGSSAIALAPPSRPWPQLRVAARRPRRSSPTRSASSSTKSWSPRAASLATRGCAPGRQA